MFEIIKAVHIITVILFVGTMFFRTFVLLGLQKHLGDEKSLELERIIGPRVRRIIKVNNVFLIASGLYLFSFHLNGGLWTLHLKATLGIIAASLFYFVPYILQKGAKIRGFRYSFHYGYFSLLITIVIYSQVMFML
jgi:hypothetical protein